MLLMKTVILFLACIALSSCQDVEINNKCSYSMNKSIFGCQDLSDSVKNIDGFITPQTRMLMIRNSNVRFAPYHHNLTNYQHLINYNIIDNNQVQIDEFAFYGMTNLNYLRITGNYLPVLKNDTFVGLDNLVFLLLPKNNISSCEPKSFVGLQSVTQINLAENKIQTIQSNLFSNLNELNHLFLDHNQIKKIEMHAFADIPNLEVIDLSFNKLEIVNTDVFNAVHKLNTLLLHFNNIKTLAGIFHLNNLKFLRLDNNNLDEIEGNTFANLENIYTIDLSHNNLSTITSQPFVHLKSLKHLHLGGNNANASFFERLKETVSVVT
ncbi:leucine-rich repeat-containing protein 70 [Tribolium castaneum]|uniref:Chaoptin-like Protein n=1 Tax=Tribolium castaneum TaxID=7070 RepID=D6W7D5_TRICA|nr:PREDICTED: leucine-rich repeat-containing protein 70 [Tribolium castaneum]EFA11128.2 Chaoptin-like Protein [Tribolium castaneum]|eukprot:XP_008200609.1 PREDICTED: leucine-rich repeat-containing protein 70 [Tribolium castaneum]